MKTKALPFPTSAEPLSAGESFRYAEVWFSDSEIRQHSKATIANRQLVLAKFKWFCQQKELTQIDPLTLRQFLGYLSLGHEQPGGRWGNAQCNKRVKPGTVATYHRILRAYCNWIEAELDVQGRAFLSPLGNIVAPVDRPDTIEPFTEEQIDALLAAAHRSDHPRRNEAILLFLLDTGVRASELCSLTMKSMDMVARKATVEGKGGKTRPVYFGAKTLRTLWRYLSEDAREDYSPIFLSDHGHTAGCALTRSGIAQLIRRLGNAAHIDGARCSPHTFRHTFAVSFLRNGGNQFSLMQLLGHTDVKMTSRYVQIAQADVANQHRQFSPVDHRRKR